MRSGELRFDGRVAIVTGAGGGLGRDYALLLASRGARVVVNDLGTGLNGDGGGAPLAEAVADEIARRGGNARASRHDVTSAEETAEMAAEAVEAFGRVDILINNAGILRDKSFAKMTSEDFRRVVDVHLFGAFNCTKAAWPIMQAQGYGRVVLTTSHAGLHGNFGQANYAAAKMGLIGLMGALKPEGARYGININAIAPVAASRMADASDLKQVRDELAPGLVSAAVAYLCSEACSESGLIIAAGGGCFGRATMVEADGVRLHPDEVTPEAVAERWPEITKLDGAGVFEGAVERLSELFPGLRATESLP